MQSDGRRRLPNALSSPRAGSYYGTYPEAILYCTLAEGGGTPADDTHRPTTRESSPAGLYLRDGRDGKREKRSPSGHTACLFCSFAAFHPLSAPSRAFWYEEPH